MIDLAAGREFYDEQGKGSGDYFFDSVFADIDALILYAGIHQKVFGYHWRLAARFSYAIYYRMDADGSLRWSIGSWIAARTRRRSELYWRGIDPK